MKKQTNIILIFLALISNNFCLKLQQSKGLVTNEFDSLIIQSQGNYGTINPTPNTPYQDNISIFYNKKRS